MKKILVMLLCAAMFAGCRGVTCRISGELPEDVTRVSVVKADRSMTPLAEAEVDADSHTFSLKCHVDEPMLALLADGDGSPLTGLFLEQGRITVEYDGLTNDFFISGTPANDRLPAVNERIDSLRLALYSAADEEEEELFWESYMDEVNEMVDENGDNILGAYLFVSLAAADLEPQQIRDRIARFPKVLRNSTMLRELDEYAVASLRTGEGASFIDVSGVDAEGRTVTLSSVAGDGKWVLLDFWATWCGPCRGEIPYLVEAYEKYADRGFEIYGVSLDNDAEGWESFTAANGMTWINVLGVGPDRSSSAAEAYGVRTIPSNFLISPEGVIYAHNLRGEELLETLAEIFD